ncbi:chemotaxis protein CheC [Solirubrobacter phytolaccae]|uniref:Chemotaxis protein CheC n=1 Tax=Solirubrobacter phytolaccae TaxID=1404360 RepID=A0A9X3NDG8_9ACTN|nr:chemotaxis protein CheC [Solirubrobacter phytolaccae]MDA0182051.1 chemotaxis protein CheC [Solirubrobacter phytolaccae]
MSASYNEVQLDALRELANIGAGTASTALSEMLGRSIDLAVPDVSVLPMADAVDQLGPAEQDITGIMLGVEGELPGTVLMLLTPENAEKICVMLGLEADSELAPSALGEIGNVVGTSYLNALAGMTGIAVEPTPPTTVTDMLGAIVESILAVRAASSDRTLLLDSSLIVEGEDCSIVFLLVPDHGGAEELLDRIGLA